MVGLRSGLGAGGNNRMLGLGKKNTGLTLPIRELKNRGQIWQDAGAANKKKGAAPWHVCDREIGKGKLCWGTNIAQDG